MVAVNPGSRMAAGGDPCAVQGFAVGEKRPSTRPIGSRMAADGAGEGAQDGQSIGVKYSRSDRSRFGEGALIRFSVVAARPYRDLHFPWWQPGPTMCGDNIYSPGAAEIATTASAV